MDRARHWWERTFHHRSVLASEGAVSSDSNVTEVRDSGAVSRVLEEKYREYWTIFKRRTPYYIPVLHWLPRYRWSEFLLRDLVAGLAVASILIPQSLAYAILAGLPPKMGLYSAWIPLLVYFVFGTSKHLSIGPDAMASIMVGTTMGNNIANPADVASMYALLGGVFLLVLGLFRLGFLDNMLARPLLVGLINAVALIIVFEQVDVFFGLQTIDQHSWEKIGYVFEHRSDINWAAFGVGLFSLAVLFTLKYLRWRYAHKISVRLMSPILVVVLLSIIFTAALHLDEKWHLKVLGTISRKYDPPAPPPGWSVASLQRHLPPAMLIAMVGFVEAIVAAKRYADKNDYVIYPNRELIAIGLLNFVGSFFHTYPTFGSLARTSITDAMGASSQMFAAVAFVIVTFTISFAGPLFYYLPRVIMASVIIYAAVSMADHHDALFYVRLKAWREVVLMLAVFIFTVVLGIELGILLMIIMSIFILVKYTSNPHIAVLGRSPQSGKYKDRKLFPDVIIDPSVIIVRIEESLFFANTDRIREIFARIELTGSLNAHPADTLATAVRIEGIVIHSRNIPDMDASAIQALGEMVRAYAKRDIVVCFVKLRESIRQQLVQADILESMDSEFVFGSIDEAVRYLQERRIHRESASQAKSMSSLATKQMGDEEDLPNLDGVQRISDLPTGGSLLDRFIPAPILSPLNNAIKTLSTPAAPAPPDEAQRGRTMQEFLYSRRRERNAPGSFGKGQKTKFEALPMREEALSRPPMSLVESPSKDFETASSTAAASTPFATNTAPPAAFFTPAPAASSSSSSSSAFPPARNPFLDNEVARSSSAPPQQPPSTPALSTIPLQDYPHSDNTVPVLLPPPPSFIPPPAAAEGEGGEDTTQRPSHSTSTEDSSLASIEDLDL